MFASFSPSYEFLESYHIPRMGTDTLHHIGVCIDVPVHLFHFEMKNKA